MSKQKVIVINTILNDVTVILYWNGIQHNNYIEVFRWPKDSPMVDIIIMTPIACIRDNE